MRVMLGVLNAGDCAQYDAGGYAEGGGCALSAPPVPWCWARVEDQSQAILPLTMATMENEHVDPTVATQIISYALDEWSCCDAITNGHRLHTCEPEIWSGDAFAPSVLSFRKPTQT